VRASDLDNIAAWLTCGAQTDKYGSTYEGQYFAGKKEGQGCLVYFNGDKYSGHFFNNKKEGQGRLEDTHRYTRGRVRGPVAEQPPGGTG
jgi:hypothetical protein